MRNPRSAFPLHRLLSVVLVIVVCLAGCGGFSFDSPTPAASSTPLPTLPPTETPSPTATPSPSPTATPQIPVPGAMPDGWQVLFADSFDASGTWFVGSSEQENQPYTTSIHDGKYIWSFMPSAAPYVTGMVPGISPDPLGDFFVTVEAQQTKGEEACTYGVMLRNSTEGGYYFRIDDREGTFSFNFVSRDEWLFYQPSGQFQTSVLSYEAPRSSAIRSGSPNVLGVIAEGPNFSLYINGELAAQITDDHVSSGKIGLSLFCDVEAEVTFDNFAVFAP
ncbi:MAG: hypothetical protein JXB30_13485 [Anaerolineae bacterium]|nr:hypothetical protein [Anaerolineae bacterium]